MKAIFKREYAGVILMVMEELTTVLSMMLGMFGFGEILAPVRRVNGILKSC